MKCSAYAGLAMLLLASGASAQWSENFDGYADGTVLDGIDGWGGWDGDSSMAAIVSNDQSRSAPHSAAVGNGGSDAIRHFDITSGAWVFTTFVYLPSDLDNISYFLIQNQYNDFGPYDWAVEIDMDPAEGTAHEPFRDPNFQMTAPLVYDQWVEIRVEFDLDNNTGDVFYNGALIGSGTWDAYSGSGILEMATIDLYAPHVATVYYDDMSLQPAGGDCYADFNNDTVVDTRDVIAFLNAWNAGDMASDCDQNSVVDTRDVICFLNAWNAGC